jgi:hypothetical protein
VQLVHRVVISIQLQSQVDIVGGDDAAGLGHQLFGDPRHLPDDRLKLRRNGTPRMAAAGGRGDVDSQISHALHIPERSPSMTPVPPSAPLTGSRPTRGPLAGPHNGQFRAGGEPPVPHHRAGPFPRKAANPCISASPIARTPTSPVRATRSAPSARADRRRARRLPPAALATETNVLTAPWGPRTSRDPCPSPAEVSAPKAPGAHRGQGLPSHGVCAGSGHEVPPVPKPCVAGSNPAGGTFTTSQNRF